MTATATLRHTAQLPKPAWGLEPQERRGESAARDFSGRRPGRPGREPRRVERLDYAVSRLTVPVPDALDFTRRYEAAVPDLPLDAVRELVARRAPWSEMKRLIGGAAPLGLFIYFRNDLGPVMQLAGDKSRCTAYLMGNHVIAERMFRYDPRAMMYAPLHTVIWEDREGRAWFTIDQPSAQFGSFGIPEVSEVGLELDHKVAALLEALSVPVPDVLR